MIKIQRPLSIKKMHLKLIKYKIRFKINILKTNTINKINTNCTKNKRININLNINIRMVNKKKKSNKILCSNNLQKLTSFKNINIDHKN
jgi:hypothetical protein